MKEKSEEPWEDHFNPFELCTINNYKSIILHNWENIFQKIFVSRTTLKLHITNINLWRNHITHFRSISEPMKLNAYGSIVWFKKTIGF